MNLELTNKAALVCGSSKGIGLAAALELATLGANVILLARSENLLRKLRSQLPNNGSQKHSYLCCDLLDLENARSKVKGVLKVQNIHILVNNAGGPPQGTIIEAETEEFQRAFEMHLYSSHTLARLVTEGMKDDNYGRIINVLSTSVKSPLNNLGVSNTLRAAMANWSKTLANELGPFGITVNNVLPGYIQTERLSQIASATAQQQNATSESVLEKMARSVPLRRIGTPAEVGAAIAFLASPAAAYISGTNITVDGGRTSCL